VLAAALAVVAAACSPAGPAPDRTATATSPATGSPSAPASSPASGPTGGTAPTGDPVAIIESIRIRPADAGADTEVGALSTQVTGAQPTLDLCYGRFGSEAHRRARRLYSVSQIEGAELGRNDVVVYDSATAAQQAITEARQAVSGCRPGVPRPSTTGDQPDASFGYVVLPAPAVSGLTPGAFAVTETMSPADGQARRATRILQRRGRIVVVLDGYTTADVALALARICAQRLAAVPAGQAGD